MGGGQDMIYEKSNECALKRSGDRILCPLLKSCKWLRGLNIDSLFKMADKVENELVKRRYEKMFPCLGDSLKALTELKVFPRIVIIGTDPYPDASATGIPFAVPDNYEKEIPRSLLTLKYSFKMHSGENNEWIQWMNEHRVLMLNCSLTYLPGHRDFSFTLWQGFIKSLIKVVTDNDRNVVFWLMGSKAWGLKQFLQDKISRSVICTCHPSRAWGGCKESSVHNDCFLRLWQDLCADLTRNIEKGEA